VRNSPVAARKPAGHSSSSERTPPGDKSQVTHTPGRARTGDIELADLE
jgi:hypothetical protein